jgi:hypothetical protein
MKLKIDIDSVPGEINIENTNKSKILRCIYHFDCGCNIDTYCLVRIYDFSSKTIVIASDIKGSTGGRDYLIYNIINDFNLDYEKMFWINHVGWFSHVFREQEEFTQILFSYKKHLIFGNELEIIEEKEITKEFVEKLIELSLDSVQLWLGLDLIAEKNSRYDNKKSSFKLLHFYLRDNLINSFRSEEMIQILSSPESKSGAIFFYPDQEQELEFIEYSEIINRDVDSLKEALVYIRKSSLDDEIVICTCIGNYNPLCTILQKKLFINSRDTSFMSIDTIEKLVEIESLNLRKSDILQYRKRIKIEDDRLQALLRLYLKQHLGYLKSEFERTMAFHETIGSNYEDRSEFLRGVFYYYPDLDPDIEYSGLFHTISLDISENRLVAPLLNEYDMQTEMVICVCLGDDEIENICAIYPR